MKKYNCSWNGLPATCSVVNVLIHSVKVPKAHWQNAFSGELRQVLIVYQDGYDFMIDNDAGDGWFKVMQGNGSPLYGSKHLAACTVIKEVPEDQVHKILSEKVLHHNELTFKRWYKETYPNDYKRYSVMMSKSEELRKNLNK